MIAKAVLSTIALWLVAFFALGKAVEPWALLFLFFVFPFFVVVFYAIDTKTIKQKREQQHIATQDIKESNTNVTPKIIILNIFAIFLGFIAVRLFGVLPVAVIALLCWLIWLAIKYIKNKKNNNQPLILERTKMDNEIENKKGIKMDETLSVVWLGNCERNAAFFGRDFEKSLEMLKLESFKIISKKDFTYIARVHIENITETEKNFIKNAVEGALNGYFSMQEFPKDIREAKESETPDIYLSIEAQEYGNTGIYYGLIMIALIDMIPAFDAKANYPIAFNRKTELGILGEYIDAGIKNVFLSLLHSLIEEENNA